MARRRSLTLHFVRLAVFLAITLAAVATTVQTCKAAIPGACGSGEDDSSLLQREGVKSLRSDKTSTRLGSRGTVPNSIYFLTVDRFGRTDGNTTRCGAGKQENLWCGGTLRGIIDKLDYIQNMGFEAIWITPVVKQYEGVEGVSGTGAMGYWAYDLYSIDPHFGTAQDMSDLVSELHKRGMVIVYDFVANHMGPIHSEADVHKIIPFNETKYYHQLFIGNMSFDEYTAKTQDWPPPAQAMWSQSGAQCTQGVDCTCWHCVVDQELGANKRGEPGGGFGGECNGKWEFNPDSPCPKDALSKYCMPGDYECEGYNTTITWGGWFYDLGDLNQTDPFVRSKQLEWIKWFVQEYDIDYLRLDTAAFMPWDFLSELQEAAGVSIMGEVTTTNLTYHAEFQSRNGQHTLDGVLNFPIYYSALSGFCGTFWPFSTFNLTFLGERMEAQQRTGYRSVERLGNFIDNHDVQRVTSVCSKDMRRITNALAWLMMSKGTPIIYQGTETFFEEIRESLWNTGYDQNSPGFHLIKRLNMIRSRINADAPQSIINLSPHGEPNNHDKLGILRGDPRKPTVVVLLNNIADGDDSESAEFCYQPPHPPHGFMWEDGLTGSVPRKNSNGCILGKDPIILILQRQKWHSHRRRSRLGGFKAEVERVAASMPSIDQSITS
eukprot:CAMPEP_0206442038 /NCGR_PEP_ID=MMETSP0324_2-20121206/13603_1 /ASSEMBLY_ACC=CAM_ASM_000836 /TAXON_ID=2866 /ORGANISM="Crypthecodinium cohnii, Strain Seligo" /LENGTH=660 /DNA_ID=CAMNT_0053909843 /DNA_START=103 /DNA_END=2085 /DNA_ORIENTATION=-